MEPPGVSRSTPRSISATATSTSSLLAASCSGVSEPGPGVSDPPTGRERLRVGAGVDEQLHNLGPVRKVTRPIGDKMQRRASAAPGRESGPCEIRVLREKTPHQVEVTAPDSGA